jgi:hypothetical protein
MTPPPLSQHAGPSLRGAHPSASLRTCFATKQSPTGDEIASQKTLAMTPQRFGITEGAVRREVLTMTASGDYFPKNGRNDRHDKGWV